jgi:hypothetical protein
MIVGTTLLRMPDLTSDHDRPAYGAREAWTGWQQESTLVRQVISLLSHAENL